MAVAARTSPGISGPLGSMQAARYQPVNRQEEAGQRNSPEERRPNRGRGEAFDAANE